MEIATLGEFGLIDRLTKDITPQNASTLRGVGDDLSPFTACIAKVWSQCQ